MREERGEIGTAQESLNTKICEMRKEAVSEGIIWDATTFLGPYSQSTVPTACAEGHAVGTNTQTADTIFVTS